jgi:signal transduction histidine kinase
MNVASQLQRLCEKLDEFGLARAIADFNSGHFVGWNKTFLQQTGYSVSEIQVLNPDDLIVQGISTFPSTRNGDPTEFRACAIRGVSEPRVFPGFVAKSSQNLAYVMLQPNSSQSLVFEQMELAAQEKERLRITTMFHDEVSSPILAAIFAIAIAKDELESNPTPKNENLERASDLLSGALEKMGEVLDPKAANAGSSPSTEVPAK